jgi:hypothetical protein
MPTERWLFLVVILCLITAGISFETTSQAVKGFSIATSIALGLLAVNMSYTWWKDKLM